MRPPAVRLVDLVKEFPATPGARHAVNGRVRAVDGLSLQIESGAFYGLLGPNGAGKTTTIRILTGLARRTSGTVEVDGMDVQTEFRAVRRRIGLAPQEFDFDQFLTTEQVLRYRGMYFEMSRREAERRARELIERFELTHKRDVRVIHLSGGQKRRLLIAKSLMHHPSLLILDEPTAGIDVSLRHDLWSYLREQNREGKTILLTTHYIEEAEALCDRVGVIDQGRLVAEGTPKELSESSGSDLVVVRLAAPCPPQALESLRPRLGFGVDASADMLQLTVHGGRGGAMASRTLECLVEAGLKVENLEIKRRSLEDAFVKITGRALDASGEARVRGGNV